MEIGVSVTALTLHNLDLCAHCPGGKKKKKILLFLGIKLQDYILLRTRQIVNEDLGILRTYFLDSCYQDTCTCLDVLCEPDLQ